MILLENMLSSNYQGFKLLRVYLMSHPVLGKQNFQFVSDTETDKGPYSTIIIGPNGTGKSQILRVVVDIFREIDSFIKQGSREQHITGDYSITYAVAGNVYEFGNVAVTQTNQLMKVRGFHAKKNGKKIPYSDLEMPSRILVSSIMLTDKFPIVKDGFESYEYLGVRRETNPGTAGTRTYITKTVDYIINSIENRSFYWRLQRILNFLDLGNSFRISYFPRYRSKFFNGNVTADYFYAFHDEFWNYTRRSKDNPPWSKQRFDNHTGKDRELVKRLAHFCNYLSEKLIAPYPGSRSRFFEFDLAKGELKPEQYELIKELRALDLISYPSITLAKNKKYFDLEESSSGEYHFLSTMVGILANLEDNSLILIDEPEISLHPNWQMKYMSFLHEMLKDLPTCHTLVATHSHFLISDLEGASSAIIGLRAEQNMDPEFIDYNTYGWSAEEVLYKVFDVKTTRNYYLELDLRELLHLIAQQSDDKPRIQLLLSRLQNLNISQKDPLNLIIDNAQTYLND